LFEGARQSLGICGIRQRLETRVKREGEKEGKRARQSLGKCVTRQSLLTRRAIPNLASKHLIF